ncbi:hypothetical protein [Nonomuraea jiangxiensis]|uniref:Transglycosylase SLT domain-containing protein n=1 Tax=Nonomuraea jiangxiensis TaxID=633440 RepID=A0A1G8QRL1_9ACTN|nr:hypothetical protein [Nonomuraea jiangxiensis]SDJ07303.1 hypothetical protein SAMN05421869_108337 [Nonomuraea jiangxiensis]
MYRNAVRIVGALIATAIMITSAGAGAASAQATSFSRELSAVARAAGVSEATAYSMALSIARSDPADDYRFPDEAFSEAPRSWGSVVAFVKRFWRKIVDAAKAAGAWTLWKAHRCATGAVSEVMKKFGEDLTDADAVVGVAIYGCIKGLRG